MTRAIAAALLLAAGPAAAQAKVAGEMIIWSGSKTRGAAEKQAQEFAAYATALDSVVEVAARVLESAKVPGLKPGFLVVALGVCQPGAAEKLLELFKALHPDVYSRAVNYRPRESAPAMGCPTFKEVTKLDAGQPVTWRPEEKIKPVRVEQAGKTLVALPFTFQWSDEGDFALDHFQSSVALLLIDGARGARRVLASELIDSNTDAEGLESLEAAGGTVRLLRSYGDPACGRGANKDEFKEYVQAVVAKVEAGEIKLEKRDPELLHEGVCGFVEESKMVSGEREEPEGEGESDGQ